MTPIQIVNWLFDLAAHGTERCPLEFGASLHQGKVFVYWPTLYTMLWDRAPRDWRLGPETTWRDLKRHLTPLLPGPLLGPEHPLTQAYAEARQRPATHFQAFDLHRAPLLAHEGLLRAPEAIADYHDHWLRQSLWAFHDADCLDPFTAGVYVHSDTATVVIHWPTRRELHDFLPPPTFRKNDVRYGKAITDYRKQMRSPLQRAMQTLIDVKRLFEENKYVAPALLSGKGARIRQHNAVVASPWYDTPNRCSVLEVDSFKASLETYVKPDVRRKHRIRFVDERLSSLLHQNPELASYGTAMEHYETAAGLDHVRIYIRPVGLKDWFLSLPGCFNGLIGDNLELLSDLSAFDGLLRRMGESRISDSDYDLYENHVFLNCRAMIEVLKYPLPRQEPILALVALYSQLENGRPLPKFRADIKPHHERQYRKYGRTYVKRGADWTVVEDDVLTSFFSPEPNGQRRHHSAEQWQNIMARLPDRTKSSVRARLTTLNKKRQLQVSVEKGRNWRQHWERVRLGQRRGPVPKLKSQQSVPPSDGTVNRSPTISERP